MLYDVFVNGVHVGRVIMAFGAPAMARPGANSGLDVRAHVVIIDGIVQTVAHPYDR